MTGKYDLGDYQVPKHGPRGKVKGGAMPKDSGQVTSRIGQIKKLAGSTPGPGKYIKHAPWPQYPPGEEFAHGSKGYRFDKDSRDKGGIIRTDKGSATPAPGRYDVTKVSQVKPRCVGGPLSKKAKKSFLDKAIAVGGSLPGPNKYNITALRTGKVHLPAPLMTTKKSETKGPVKKTQVPGPGHYDTSKGDSLTMAAEPRPVWARGKIRTITDKASAKNPGPGQYRSIALEKISRGTKWNQVHGYGRNALHGVF
ncbi:hypothetical protein FOL46_005823 [Perkinsus olseni]|uniref:Uncharacterized protein n=1 Tax=Perkinsus olseni TaxID=32597 RepID=A0A7J6LQ72_PEROL|nr:hypothetical protein FOL46_005823 [Perkinsus olseni]